MQKTIEMWQVYKNILSVFSILYAAEMLRGGLGMGDGGFWSLMQSVQRKVMQMNKNFDFWRINALLK